MKGAFEWPGNWPTVLEELRIAHLSDAARIFVEAQRLCQTRDEAVLVRNVIERVCGRFSYEQLLVAIRQSRDERLAETERKAELAAAPAARTLQITIKASARRTRAAAVRNYRPGPPLAADLVTNVGAETYRLWRPRVQPTTLDDYDRMRDRVRRKTALDPMTRETPKAWWREKQAGLLASAWPTTNEIREVCEHTH